MVGKNNAPGRLREGTYTIFAKGSAVSVVSALAAFAVACSHTTAGVMGGKRHIDTTVDHLAEMPDDGKSILVGIHIPCEVEMPQTDPIPSVMRSQSLHMSFRAKTRP